MNSHKLNAICLPHKNAAALFCNLTAQIQCVLKKYSVHTNKKLASFADTFVACHAIFQPLMGRKDCMMSQKSICKGG